MADSAKGRGGGATDDAADVARDICAKHGDRADRLIEILHDVQARLGHIPADTIDPIAKAINRSRAEVHGVVTFYHDFRDRPAGRHVVKLCRAEACQAVGCENLTKRAEELLGVSCGATTADGRVTLEAIYCLGNCALGPAVMVDGDVHGVMNINKLSRVIKELN